MYSLGALDDFKKAWLWIVFLPVSGRGEDETDRASVSISSFISHRVDSLIRGGTGAICNSVDNSSILLNFFIWIFSGRIRMNMQAFIEKCIHHPKTVLKKISLTSLSKAPPLTSNRWLKSTGNMAETGGQGRLGGGVWRGGSLTGTNTTKTICITYSYTACKAANQSDF